MTIPSRRIRLDAATACQLRCPACPTAAGDVGKHIGTGFLRFEDFRNIVDGNPWLSRIELSNWGEIFLNPHLVDIVKYAYEKDVALTARNGVNLNNAREDALEAVVKYKFDFLSVSLDGATPETYEIYRVGGDFDTVIANVKKINEYKKEYRSKYPVLRWQFIGLGHNEHEIELARKMATELGMKFVVKLNWEDLYTDTFSPTEDDDLIRKASKRGEASRSQFENEHGAPYKSKTCTQLWVDPVINYDGRILGCCINHWGDFGQADKSDLRKSLENEKITHAREMLLGKSAPRSDIPCTTCSVYETMQKNDTWLSETKIRAKRTAPRALVRLRKKLLPRLIGR